MRERLRLHRLSLVAVSSTWHYTEEGELKAQRSSDKVRQVETGRPFLVVCLRMLKGFFFFLILSSPSDVPITSFFLSPEAYII